MQALFESNMAKLHVELFLEKMLNAEFFKSIHPSGPVVGKKFENFLRIN